MNGEVGMLGLFERNLAAGLLILVILLVRAAFSERLSRRVILPLWGIAALRIVLPFSLKLLLPSRSPVIPKALVMAVPNGGEAGFDLLPTAYTAAAVLVFGGFLLAHFRSRRVFREAVPCTDRTVLQTVKSGSKRQIRVRVSDRILAPLTCGLFRPTILLPKMMTETGEEIELILAHELTHIRRGDLFYKLLLVGAVSFGWLNPLAWVMLILANRDLEFACDEAVLKKYPARRAEYARMLIRAEERKNNIFAAAFSGNAVKERIERIMKLKKTTIFGAIAAAALAAVSMAVFVSADEAKSVQWYVSDENGTKAVSEEEANAAMDRKDALVYRFETDGETVSVEDFGVEAADDSTGMITVTFCGDEENVDVSEYGYKIGADGNVEILFEDSRFVYYTIDEDGSLETMSEAEYEKMKAIHEQLTGGEAAVTTVVAPAVEVE